MYMVEGDFSCSKKKKKKTSKCASRFKRAYFYQIRSCLQNDAFRVIE